MLQTILVLGKDVPDRLVTRAARLFNLNCRGLSIGQTRRWRRMGWHRSTACRMLMRSADATLWFTHGAAPKIPKRLADHPLMLVDVVKPVAAETVAQWIASRPIDTLHITGVREGDDLVFGYLCGVLGALGLSFTQPAYGTQPAPDCILLIDKTHPLLVSPWPGFKVYRRGRQWRSDGAGTARAIRLLKENSTDPRRKEFLLRVPAEAQAALTRFRDAHRPFIRLFRTFEEPMNNLVRAGDWMLIYMLCHRQHFHELAKLDREDLAELLSQPARNIWPWFGLPGSESTVNQMREIPAEWCSFAMWRRMRERLAPQPILLAARTDLKTYSVCQNCNPTI